MIALQPLTVELVNAQEIIIDPNGNVGFKPQLKRSSRPQIVDIAKPNSGGVSHNQYSRFDSTSRGVILNNSKTTSQTKLNGNVAGNPNLADGTAAVILNEVTSSRASVLNGAVEVAGDRAKVIIANPNGITCNGCGFINASEGTLTTGVPVVNGDDVTLNVDRGKITIGRRGLVGRAGHRNEIDRINLIAREIFVDGPVTAKTEINIQGGAQSYSLKSRSKVGTISGTSTGHVYSVDATEFGAMDAGRIRIIGTERGLGVRGLGAINAASSSAQVVNEGNVRVRSVTAKNRVQVQSRYGAAFVENDLVSTHQDIVVSGRRSLKLEHSAGLYGKTKVYARASHGLASVFGELQSDGQIDILGRELKFAAYAQTPGKVRFDIINNIEFDGGTVVADQIEFVRSPNVDLSNSALFSAKNVVVTAADFRLGEAVVVDGLTDADTSTLIATASGNFTNNADLRNHTDDTITYAGDLINEVQGVINEQQVRLNLTGDLTNSGVIYGRDRVDIDVSIFENTETGSVLSDTRLDIDARESFKNAGTIISGGTANLKSPKAIENDGFVQAAALSMSGLSVTNGVSGEMRAQTSMHLRATGEVLNKGLLGSTGRFLVTSGGFRNEGSVLSELDQTIRVDDFLNSGSMIAGTAFYVDAVGAAENSGNVTAYGGTRFYSDVEFRNRGQIFSDGALTVSAPSFKNLGRDSYIRATALSVSGPRMENYGEIQVLNDINLKSRLNYFYNDGILASTGRLEMVGLGLDSQLILGNKSSLVSGLKLGDASNDLTLGERMTLSFDTVRAAGTIASGGTLSLTGTTLAEISGKVRAEQGIYITSPTLDVKESAILYTPARARFTVSGSFSNAGQISTGDFLQFSAGFGSFDNSGVIATRYTRDWNTKAFNNTGAIQADTSFVLNASSVQNDGHLQGRSVVRITTPGNVRHNGTLSTDGQLYVAARDLTFGAGSQTAGGNLDINVRRFYNYGDTVLSRDASNVRNTWTIAQGLYQRGITYSPGEYRITAGSISSQGNSVLSSNRTVNLTTTGALNASGAITGNRVVIKAGSLSGATTGSIVAVDDVLATVTGVARHDGEISAGDLLRVTANDLDIRGNAFGDRVELTSATRIYTRGKVISNSWIKATAGGYFENRGLIEAQSWARLTSTTGSIRNRSTGTIRSTDLNFQAANWVQNDKTIFAASDLNIDAAAFKNVAGATATAVGLGVEVTGAFANGGLLDVYGLFAKAGGAASNTGTIRSKTYVGLEAASFAQGSTGRIIGDGHVFVGTSGLVTNAGQIRAENIDLRAVGGLTNSKLIAAADTVNIADADGEIVNTSAGQVYGQVISAQTKDDFTNAGTFGSTSTNSYARAEDVYVKSKAFENSKNIYSRDIRINAKGYVNNTATGNLRAQDYVGISTTGSVSNAGIVRGKTAVVEAGSTFNNEYQFKFTDGITVDAGSIRNRSLNTRKAEILAKNIVLTSNTWVNNAGKLFGYERLGVQAKNGSLVNSGQITGPDITLISDRNNVSSSSGIYSGGRLAISARAINLDSNVTSTEAITLYTSHYDVTALGALTTKELKIEAARNLRAAAGALRGSVLTQVVADDIKRRSSGSYVSTNKLSLLRSSDVKGDVYVRLRTGSIGTFVDNTGTKDVFDPVNLDVKGNVSLITNEGAIVLRGTIKSDKQLYIRANKNSTSLKNITLASGTTMHLSGRNYLKNHGGVNLDPGTKLELDQNYGWLYTADWFGGQERLDYHLTIDAKQVVINSDHRLVNKDLVVRATQDIVQRNSVISARGITYGAGRDVKITFSPFVWRDEYRSPSSGSWLTRIIDSLYFGSSLSGGTRAVKTNDWWDVSSAGLRGHTLIAQSRGLSIYSGQDVKLQSGKISTSGTLNISAQRNILSEPIYLETGKNNRPGYVGWSFSNKYKGVISGHDRSKVQISELRAYENQLHGAKGANLTAGGFVTLIGTKLESSQGDITVRAENGGVNLVAAPGYWTYNYSKTTTKRVALFFKKRTTVTYTALNDIYKRSILKANKGVIRLESRGDQGNADFASVLSAGSTLQAKEIYVKTAAGDISLGTYAERSITSSTKKSSLKLLFIPLGSRSTSDKRHVTVNYGNNFAADTLLDIDSGRNLNIQDGVFSAPVKRLNAIGNINIVASINTSRRDYYDQSTNLITITTINSGYVRETASLPRFNGPEPVFTAGGDTFIRGARGATLNDQLLDVLSSTSFRDPLDDLFGTAERNSANAAEQTINQEFLRDFTLPGAADGQQFAYLDTLIADGATYETIQLRDQEWYDKQVQLNPAFQALLQVVATYVTGGVASGLGITNTFVAAGVNAATADLVAGVVGGAITGDIDLGDVLEGAVLRGFTVGVSSAVTDSFNLNELLGVSDNTPFLNDLSPNITTGSLLDGFGDAIVNQVISNTFQGQDPFANLDDAVRGYVVGQAMAIAQFQIGEVGVGQANWEGSFGHLLLHGGVGCLASEAVGGDCAAGFFGGASQSILAGSSLSDEQKAQLAPLVGAFAGFLVADGNALNVSFASSVASSGLYNNYLTHAESLTLIDALNECHHGSGARCDEVQELAELDAQRNLQLRNCVGDYSSLCVQARANVAIALAEYIEAGAAGFGSDHQSYRIGRGELAFLYLQYADDADFDYRNPIDSSGFVNPLAVSVLEETFAANDYSIRGYVGPGTAVIAAELGSGMTSASMIARNLNTRSLIVDTVERPNTATFRIGRSDGGPGTWRRDTEGISGADQAYQRRVTGAPDNTTYSVPDANAASGRISFDGYDPARRVLLDAKNFRNWPIDQPFATRAVVDQAFRQQRVARLTGNTVEWHVPNQAAATRVQNAFQNAPAGQTIDPNIVRIVVTPAN